jgi:4-amino-4-deoxy-L-arabinose transferase-like glycosyltransferase
VTPILAPGTQRTADEVRPLAHRKREMQPTRPLGRMAVTQARTRRADIALALLLTLVALVARTINLRHSPSLTSFDDEGIYVAQAWSVLRQGRLSPYTYVYDHAPAGWILLAGWMRLVGGPLALGNAIDTARALTVGLGILSVPLLYMIARRMGCPPAATAAGTGLYAVSPLATFYGRLVLLDTIMVFWLLLSVALLLAGGGAYWRWLLSGACFGLAILSKEAGVAFVPAALLLVYMQRRPSSARAALATWVLPAMAVVSLYPLYAAVRGELLPSAPSHFLMFTIGGGPPHISLVDAILWQATRGGGGLLNRQNMFWDAFLTDWLRRDPIVAVAGSVAVLVNLARGIRSRRLLVTGVLGALPLLYLARGGLVYSFYIVAALPWLCLNLAAIIAPALARLPRPAHPLRLSAALACTASVLLLGFYWRIGSLGPVYTERPAADAREAVAWVKGHVPPESTMIVNDNWWTDLREAGRNGPAFPNAHSHWKVAFETDVSQGVFHDDWRIVRYIFITAGTKHTFEVTNNAVAQEALRRSHLARVWGAGPEAIELWQVDAPTADDLSLMADSAAFISQHFDEGGALALTDGTVTAQNQASALLRAVWSDNRSGFYESWRWTKESLLNRAGLLSSVWRGGSVVDGRSTSDADTDAALALLLASKHWKDPDLEAAGRVMVQSIWRDEVVTVGGAPYLLAGDWAAQGSVLAVRLSHLAPYAYHIFQEVDSEHDWLGLVASSYDILSAAASLQSRVPPGGWVGVNRMSGAIVELPTTPNPPGTVGAGDPQEAMAATCWRIALHRNWTVRWSSGGDGRARAYLEQASRLPPKSTGESALARSAGALAVRSALDPASAAAVFAAEVSATARRDGSGVYWDAPDDLATQQWGWLATAIHTGALIDLWHAG